MGNILIYIRKKKNNKNVVLYKYLRLNKYIFKFNFNLFFLLTNIIMFFSEKNNIEDIRYDLFEKGGLFYAMTESKWANFKKQFLLASRTYDDRTLTSRAKSAFTST